MRRASEKWLNKKHQESDYQSQGIDILMIVSNLSLFSSAAFHKFYTVFKALCVIVFGAARPRFINFSTGKFII